MTNSKSQETLFSKIQLTEGYIGLFGRTILAAEQLCRTQGVYLSFATPSEYLAVNEANRDSWLPLASFFHPTYSTLSAQNSVFILGRNAMNDVVACQACRFFDWRDTNFAEECESLRFFYDDPLAMRNANEHVKCTSLAARGTSGKVAYSGAAWYRRDYRGKGLVEWLPRLSRAYAAGVWGTTTTITLMAENNVKKGVFPRNGYRNLEWEINAANTKGGTLRFAYLWTKNDEMKDDLALFLAGLEQAVLPGRSAIGRD